MSFVLFVLGLAATAAGVLTIGFGIPINEFSLGNTLIIAGTTMLASGLVVVALAITNRQLKKIADILMSRPGGAVSGRSSDVLEQATGAGRIAAPRPPLPAGADATARGPAYPSERPLRKPPRNADPDEAEDDEFEQPRMGRPAGSPRAPDFDPIEDVPLSPRTQPRIPGTPPASDPKAGQKGWRPPGARPSAPPVDPVRHEPSLGAPERPQRPAPDAAFDSIWPSGRGPERSDPQPDFPPDPAPAAAPGSNGDATHRDGPSARPATENVPVSVLKSGVVDGMAYTLYTDGSIEAELAQGVVRFGSIEELRNHLEKGA